MCTRVIVSLLQLASWQESSNVQKSEVFNWKNWYVVKKYRRSTTSV